MKSEFANINPASFDSVDILLTDALTSAEYEFYDTIRIKIGYEKGTESYYRLLATADNETLK